MVTNITQTLAQYIVQAKYRDFPTDIVHKAKQLVLDNIGCAFAGYATDAGKVLVSFAREISDKEEATIIGDGTRVSCLVSAGVNAQMANILDFDDTSVAGHPGSATVQTAISLGERLGASGKEVIEATIIGYEAINRIAQGAPVHTSKYRETPYAIPISHHVFGSAVAAAKILRLTVSQTKDAIGTAGAIAPTFNVLRLIDRPASPTKAGNLWNCWTGISAAFLAQKGFGGPLDYLDGNKGYWSLFADEVNFEAMIAGLGKYYVTSEIQFKPWSTCRFNQPGIQLTLGIIKEAGIKPEDIEEITVKGHKLATSFPFNGQKPVESWDAVWSTPWAIAMAVLGYEPGPDWYAKERFQDPAVLNLAAKVKTETLPEAERIIKQRGLRKLPPCEVELKANGRTYIRRMEGVKGDPDQPMTEEEFLGKFRSQASRCLSTTQVEEVIKIVDKLEDLPGIVDLTRRLKPV